MKANKRQLKAFTKEEFKTAKLYKSLGFKRQGKQEYSHAKFFGKLSRGGGK